ncbi:hypothetical protein T492DRAFT_1093214 [Pavlovales sp. CCMP2436]|nr:hypothetical protein T492DRAFT_1093214 [Pavlovales sp. CCMP2436]|mmetsp:Transcript_20898/g.52995  ORF Transcript_20898/g.52995 Transcript_20898/m.52995 type:complete len:394 (+) Transcript_20898:1488-2669(+)
MAAVASDVGTFLRGAREAHADVSDDYARMEELYTRKLWHQLTLAIAAFVAQPRLQGTDGDELAQLYEHFIRHFELKMNSLSLAKLVIAISRFFPAERASMFVSALVSKVSADQEAVTLCKTEIARLKLKTGDVAGCKELLDEAQVTVDLLAGMDVDIHISYYTTLAQYFKLQGPAMQFYKAALLLLSYQPLDKMEPSDALTLSFDLGLAALVAKSVYNFGELLQHPIVAQLESATEHAWLAQLLRVFNAGDIEMYEQLIGAHRAQLEAQPALVAHAAFLKEKIALMSLMELVFGHVGPQANHKLSFELVAQRVRLPVSEVELLLMRAMSLELVRGEIDEIDQIITVSWVQPRVLTAAQVASMAELLQGWKTQVGTSLLFLEAEAPEFGQDANF